jgi:hypothetical protein
MSQVPPIEPTLEIDPEDRPSWPKVIGILSIVFGALGLLCNGCGVLSPVLLGMVPLPPGETALPPTMTPGPLLLGLYAAGLLTAIFLLIAGITCVQRSYAARTMHLIYGAASVLLVIAGIVLQLQLMAQMDQWVKDNASSQFAKQHNPAFSIIGLAVGSLIGASWPVFCLIWFGVVKTTPASFHVKARAD